MVETKYLINHHQIKSILEFSVMFKECFGNDFRVVANVWFGQIRIADDGYDQKVN